jgi:hypothetical protein
MGRRGQVKWSKLQEGCCNVKRFEKGIIFVFFINEEEEVEERKLSGFNSFKIIDENFVSNSINITDVSNS